LLGSCAGSAVEAGRECRVALRQAGRQTTKQAAEYSFWSAAAAAVAHAEAAAAYLLFCDGLNPDACCNENLWSAMRRNLQQLCNLQIMLMLLQIY
jgi:hypothetical protein